MWKLWILKATLKKNKIKIINRENVVSETFGSGNKQTIIVRKTIYLVITVLLGAVFILGLGIVIKKYDIKNAGECLGYAGLIAEVRHLI